jgi:hypothetical protein
MPSRSAGRDYVSHVRAAWCQWCQGPTHLITPLDRLLLELRVHEVAQEGQAHLQVEGKVEGKV